LNQSEKENQKRNCALRNDYLRVSDFDYPLPEELIATHPCQRRDESRLLVLHKKTGRIEHRLFRDITDYLREGDVIVLNNTRVLKARLLGHRQTGGKAELLFLRSLDEGRFLCLIGTRGHAKRGETFVFGEGALKVRVLQKDELGQFVVEVVKGDVYEAMRQFGLVPLPPYITKKRGTKKTTSVDEQRYQTVYAAENGSAAAPTAGLHFTHSLLQEIRKLGVSVLFVTLHIGYATFRPVKCEHPSEHKMHEEVYRVEEDVWRRIGDARRAGGRVFCVGTTTVRTLETVARTDKLTGVTDLFIYPPFQFRLTDCLVTNFHLPRSTLLMLVCAFGGREAVLRAYREAVARGYRFYSYGDAMLIL